MKVRVPNIIEAMLFVAGGGLLLMGGYWLADALEPPPLRFDSLEVITADTGGMNIAANVQRRDTPGCTNGVQAELRQGRYERRLNAPVRTSVDQTAFYDVSFSPRLEPGRYEIKLRETFLCSDKVTPVEAPWLAFEVG